ncbi:hypothetical protein NHX12_009282 [Muraenolepis orangiensis]|uniref:Secreted protein n=1 Tax=Muraenolepis orangiensis TaxID=630683 RepID=A0A9Q0DN76_9TELE|nr:hypothetical protein NHX12_009282 [Muraenolepis orangiensis]
MDIMLLSVIVCLSVMRFCRAPGPSCSGGHWIHCGRNHSGVLRCRHDVRSGRSERRCGGSGHHSGCVAVSRCGWYGHSCYCWNRLYRGSTDSSTGYSHLNPAGTDVLCANLAKQMKSNIGIFLLLI